MQSLPGFQRGALHNTDLSTNPQWSANHHGLQPTSGLVGEGIVGSSRGNTIRNNRAHSSERMMVWAGFLRRGCDEVLFSE